MTECYVPGAGPAVLDAGRRANGTYVPNGRGNRRAVERGAGSVQEDLADDPIAAAVTAGC